MARINPLHLIPALIAAASQAGEVTIEKGPFVVEKSFNATALPGGDCQLLKLDPKAWGDFKLTTIATHGAKVSKGEVLVAFETDKIDEKIEDLRRSLASGALTLAQAEQDLKLLEETSANKLEAARRAAEIAKEENTYFTKVRRKAGEETAAQALKRTEQMLSNQREELRQLTKMYKEDDLTEETEEIVLIRQQDAVAAAEFALSMEVLDHKRTIETLLPREAKTLADAERDTAIAFKKVETEIPRSVELKKIDLEAMKTANARAKQDLDDLVADRALFETKAPGDGFFYHGPIENGRWLPAEVVKVLVPFGQPPVHKAFATFFPATSKLALVSFLDEATAGALDPELAGIATLPGREETEVPVKLVKLSPTPGPDGTYRADFSATWPKELVPAAGATAQVKVVAYQQAAAIVVPTKALTFESSGWTVEVKLADGKTERRSVKRGRVAKEQTEIVSGLEEGQVIVIPSAS